MPESVRLEVCQRSDRRVEELEYEVYLRAGYIAPNPHRRVLENDDYPDHLVVAAFCGDILAGSVRVVVDSHPKDGLLTLHCFEPFEIWPWAEDMLQRVQTGGLMQIGTMVIREEFRGGAVCQAMLQRLIEMFVEARIHFAVATIDEKFFSSLSARKVPMVPMGHTLHYMGSRTVPVLSAREWVTRGVVPPCIRNLALNSAEAVPSLEAAACSA